MEYLKELISTRRKELNLTQKDLAEKLNVSDKTISKWETGKSYPDITLLKNIAKVLQIDVAELLNFEESKDHLDQKEEVDVNLIDSFKSRIFLVIGCMISGFILCFVPALISDENIQMLVFAFGVILVVFSLIFFVSSCISYRSIYINKFETKDYDIVFSNYTSLTIVIFSLPFILMSLLVNSINITTIGGIVNLFSFLIILTSMITLTKIFKMAHFKIRKDRFSKLLGIISILLFLLILTNLLPFFTLPVIYTLVFIIILRKEYLTLH